ncbi:MAG TPA: DegV family protein [Dehalococcoidia bacterium]|nr:DegV family protein [Dehalococcoidia bacterium]
MDESRSPTEPFALVSDTGHSLPPQMVDNLRVAQVPFTINFGVEGSLDDGVMDVEEFAELLDRYEKGKGYPTTAAPPPARFVDAFTGYIKQGFSRILTVTLSHKLSKTYDSAVQAADEVGQEYPGSEIEVVDSLGGSMVEGMLIMEAACARDRGRPLQEVKAVLEEMRERLGFLAAFETTKYLLRSGRARSFQHLLASALAVRPIITLRDGAAILYGRMRGRMDNTLDRIVEEVQRTYKAGPIAVIEGVAPDLREKLVAKLCQRLNVAREQILETKVGPTFLVHTGKRAVGVVWERAKPPQREPQRP